MNVEIIKECNRLGAENKITFPEVVQKFAADGIERYRVDFTRSENTYYWQTGESHILPLEYKTPPVPENFDKAAVQETIRQVQQGKFGYGEFLNRITAAGCSHYDVYITGQRVIYSGRNGDTHTEFFPGSK